MLVASRPLTRLGVPQDRAELRFGPLKDDVPYSARHLFKAGKPAFELSLWCGTCPFLFERKEGAVGTVSTDVGQIEELETGMDDINDAVVARFGGLIPAGSYLPLLLEVQPELVAPNDSRDYFTHEQVATWGVDSFWALPENPRSFYYRTFETPVSADEHLYEFVVPMVPPSWNEAARVEHYRDAIGRGITPTAVALSTLDVCQPAMDDESTDYYGHWGLTHFLLDGHHKFHAAATIGANVRLLALVSAGGSLVGSDYIDRLPDLLRQDPLPRPEVSPGWAH
ncbi:hypothetical protein [Intrasporangium mesophilum]